MGPLIHDEARQYVLAFIESAVADGAEIVIGGQAVEEPGFFSEPRSP